MEKILMAPTMAPISMTNLSRDSMKLALKFVAIHDEMEESWPISAEALKLDEETRQKLQQLQHDFSTRP